MRADTPIAETEAMQFRQTGKHGIGLGFFSLAATSGLATAPEPARMKTPQHLVWYHRSDNFGGLVPCPFHTSGGE